MKKKESISPPTPDLQTVMEDRSTTLQRIGDTLVGATPSKTKSELLDGINEVLTLVDDETVSQDLKDLLNDIGGKSLKRKTKSELMDIWDLIKNIDNPMEKSLGAMLKMATRNVSRVDTDVEAQLNNIDFANLIGGPMQAAIQAQANAAMSTVNFIKEVGFYQEGEGEDKVNKLHYVDFSYEKEGAPNYIRDDDGKIILGTDGKPQIDPDNPPDTETKKIKVPLLTMLTIPSIRIETLDIDFNAKLNSVEEAKKSDKLGIDLNASAKFGPVKMKVTASYQRNSSHGVKVSKEYSMNVKVKATQDELPAGLEKILNLLE